MQYEDCNLPYSKNIDHLLHTNWFLEFRNLTNLCSYILQFHVHLPLNVQFFSTLDLSKDSLSIGAIVGIVVGVFIVLFVVVDVFCYVKNKCGILMCIKEKVGGGHGDEGYSAAKTDDVENL